jgi:hypothetical protein
MGHFLENWGAGAQTMAPSYGRALMGVTAISGIRSRGHLLLRVIRTAEGYPAAETLSVRNTLLSRRDGP